ncbi:dihydrolipoyllysine-residue acetyltransferase [Halotalea alkalilenta]|uniref:dihydrolipoyllysine-residue acetyltransferase n=1 Tax=Halotalea alkalilenta TaxID=376489 RepID=UPI0004825B30|nr:dihydrolipoyllysine-residue acetyltransferase [Halotalea alkalilenta]
MSSEIIKLPDIGDSEGVEIIEISVKEGDQIAAEDTLIVLESDKASMDIPSPKAGKVKRVLVKEGDKVSAGDEIVELELEGGDESEAPAKAEAAAEPKAEEPAREQPTASAPQGGGSREVETREVEIKVPDIGESAVEIIEVAVKTGDQVEAEDALITLESDKASMDVPSPHKGKIIELSVKEGDSVSTGDVIGRMEVAGEGAAEPADEAPAKAQASSESVETEAEPEPAAAASGEPERKELRVPDIGSDDAVPVIEVAIKVGDEIEAEGTLLTLESDKASMDVPSPFKGKVVEVAVKEGDALKQGDLIGYIEVAGAAKPAPKAQPSKAEPGKPAQPAAAQPGAAPAVAREPSTESLSAEQREARPVVHAGPAVRLLARELGVALEQVKGTGPRERILKEDVHAYVKQLMSQAGAAKPAAAAVPAAGAGIPPIPAVDFSQFGEVEEKPMGRLLKAGATNLHRSWLNVPHVTQFDEADITELEAFRKSMKEEAAKQGAKLTPLPFMIKASAYALKRFPQFNVSLHPDGDKLVWKKYVHIGVAVDTPDGLMVPVLRDADKKSVLEIAVEFADLAKRTLDKKLKREEMTGGCFTISSLGSIGGTAFTPIVNAPEVAILGVSKAQMKPVWDGKAFQPRLMMPLCLSYDHRALNGADAARFTAFLAELLSDIRRLVL